MDDIFLDKLYNYQYVFLFLKIGFVRKKPENSKVLNFHYISETQRLRRSPGCREKRVQGVLDLPRGGSHADQNLLRHGGRRRGLDCKKYKIE